jgi:EpsI family protein
MSLMFKSGLILIALLVTLYLGNSLKPVTVLSPDNIPNLEQIIPVKFNDWSMDENLPMIVADPEMDKTINKIYNQTVNRTYSNSKGQMVMLSISYGEVQDKTSQVHFPEVCYPAQGFEILNDELSTLYLDNRKIPLKRIETQNGSRKEYVSYWIRLGDEIVLDRFDQKIKTLEYGLKGKVPDGLLFRVSMISLEESYKVQESFSLKLLRSIDPDSLDFLIGVKDSNAN